MESSGVDDMFVFQYHLLCFCVFLYDCSTSNTSVTDLISSEYNFPNFRGVSPHKDQTYQNVQGPYFVFLVVPGTYKYSQYTQKVSINNQH